jgi:hypothetical protein
MRRPRDGKPVAGAPDRIDSDRLEAIFTLKGAFGVQNANAFCRTCDPCLRSYTCTQWALSPWKIPAVNHYVHAALIVCKVNAYEALYVGKSLRLRGRIKNHLNNLRLMRHLQDAKSGRRVVIAGQIFTRPGQQIAKSLSTLERAFIRHFLAEGHDLVNKQGVRIRRHEIESQGPLPRTFIPYAHWV